MIRYLASQFLLWFGTSVMYLFMAFLSIVFTIGSINTGWYFPLFLTIGVLIGAWLCKDLYDHYHYGLEPHTQHNYTKLGFWIVAVPLVPLIWPYFVLVVNAVHQLTNVIDGVMPSYWGDK